MSGRHEIALATSSNVRGVNSRKTQVAGAGSSLLLADIISVVSLEEARSAGDMIACLKCSHKGANVYIFYETSRKLVTDIM